MARLTENLNLQRALLRHLDLMPGVQVFDKVKVSSIEQERREGGRGWPLVHLSDGRTLRTRLLVSDAAMRTSLIYELVVGRCRWFQLARSFLCRHFILRLGIRHTSNRRNALAPSKSRLSAFKYYRVPKVPTHRSYRILATITHRFLSGLVYQSSSRLCAGEIGSCYPGKHDKCGFPFAGSVHALST